MAYGVDWTAQEYSSQAQSRRITPSGAMVGAAGGQVGALAVAYDRGQEATLPSLRIQHRLDGVAG